MLINISLYKQQLRYRSPLHLYQEWLDVREARIRLLLTAIKLFPASILSPRRTCASGAYPQLTCRGKLARTGISVPSLQYRE